MQKYLTRINKYIRKFDDRKSNIDHLFQRVREWWKPDNNMDMKRARENSLELAVGRAYTCVKGLRRSAAF